MTKPNSRTGQPWLDNVDGSKVLTLAKDCDPWSLFGIAQWLQLLKEKCIFFLFGSQIEQRLTSSKRRGLDADRTISDKIDAVSLGQNMLIVSLMWSELMCSMLARAAILCRVSFEDKAKPMVDYWAWRRIVMVINLAEMVNAEEEARKCCTNGRYVSRACPALPSKSYERTWILSSIGIQGHRYLDPTRSPWRAARLLFHGTVREKKYQIFRTKWALLMRRGTRTSNWWGMRWHFVHHDANSQYWTILYCSSRWTSSSHLTRWLCHAVLWWNDLSNTISSTQAFGKSVFTILLSWNHIYSSAMLPRSLT